MQNSKTDSNFFDYAGYSISESLFVILPLIVLSLVDIYKQKSYWDIVSSPEWSFAAAIFFGQVLIKLFQTLIISHNMKAYTVKSNRIICVVAGFIVLGFVPSLIVLAIVLVMETPTTLFVILQMLIFIFGFFSFLFGGMLLKEIEDNKESVLKNK